jgi:nucleotide-binding universal stress UspA family protein
VAPLIGQSPEEVFGPALELANLFNSRLDVLRVVKPVFRPSYMPDGATVRTLPEGVLEEIQKAQAKKEARAQVYLDDVSDELAEDGYLVEAHIVMDERPADGIEAKARHTDLIAMETHARGGLARLFLGSVAGKVVRDGVAPVLLHHHRQARN